MRRNNQYFLRNVGDTYILYPSDEVEKSKQNVIFLNETSAFLWQKMDGDFEVDDLAKALSAQYVVEDHTALQDVMEFIGFLKENGCIG